MACRDAESSVETLACSVRMPLCNGEKSNSFSKSGSSATSLGSTKAPSNEAQPFDSSSGSSSDSSSGSSSGASSATTGSSNTANAQTLAVAGGILTLALGLLLA
jgi:hypothetical protein